MGSIEQKIHDAAPRNKELLSILSETDYAPPATAQQEKYLADMKQELKNVNQQLEELEIKRKKELKEHEKYRDSVMKRFAYRMTRQADKFDAKAQKEEQEYLDCLREEHQASSHKSSLESNLTIAESQLVTLTGVLSRHKEAQAHLDELYDSIFDGPTPNYPKEDKQEVLAHEALSSYHHTITNLESEQQALTLLRLAQSKCQAAGYRLNSALTSSEYDIYFRSAILDFMENEDIAQAVNLLGETQSLFVQASRLSPYITQLPWPRITEGRSMGSIIFDNIFTDLQFYEQVKASVREMETCAVALDKVAADCRVRVTDLKKKSSEEGQVLGNARERLQKVREEIFASSSRDEMKNQG